jgi:hypothetical protein
MHASYGLGFEPVCFMLLCVDHINVVTGLTFSITGIRYMTIKMLPDRRMVLQVIGCAAFCVVTGLSVHCHRRVEHKRTEIKLDK